MDAYKQSSVHTASLVDSYSIFSYIGPMLSCKANRYLSIYSAFSPNGYSINNMGACTQVSLLAKPLTQTQVPLLNMPICIHHTTPEPGVKAHVLQNPLLYSDIGT